MPVTLVDEGSGRAETQEEELSQQYAAASGLPGLVAASRNGTRYYYPWCGGISRIKETNKVWFDSEAAAKTAGYTLASGCESW